MKNAHKQSGDWHAFAPQTGAVPNQPRANALPDPGLRKTKPFGIIHRLHIPERGASTPVTLGSDVEKTRRKLCVWRPGLRDSGRYSNDTGSLHALHTHRLLTHVAQPGRSHGARTGSRVSKDAAATQETPMSPRRTTARQRRAAVLCGKAGL